MSVATLQLDPVSLFLRLHNERHICFLTGRARQRWKTIIAFDPAEVLSSNASNTEGFLDFVTRSTARGRKLIGYLAYEVGCQLHGIPLHTHDDLRLPGIFFCAYDNYISFHGDHAVLHYKDPVFPRRVADICRRTLLKEPSHKPCCFVPELSRRQYHAAFQRIKKYIYEGEIYQVNFAHRLTGQSESSAQSLFTFLYKKNPVGFLAFLDGGDFQILSASPEHFVRIRGGAISTFPIKGTRPCCGHSGTAARYRAELVRDAKEQAELNMITDLLRNDLGKVCAVGSVRLKQRRLLQQCAAVWHTYAVVSGRLAAGTQPVLALLSMLPGGSISGCPKRRALEIIDELEPVARGVYTGVIGTIDPNQTMDFSIAIRTVIKKENRLWLSVGGGIVYDSNEEQEYQETFAKARSLQGL